MFGIRVWKGVATMTRTPDDAKKGLECCTSRDCGGNKCPYFNEKSCNEAKSADALALIQRLDRTIVDQEKLAKKFYDQKVEAENKILKLEDRVKQLETERDALINEIDTYQHPCDCCKHAEEEASKEPCARCKQIFKGRKSHFEWRGVKKEK